MKTENINQNSIDNADIIKMDVPLFIRMLEYSKEDAKTDMDLHKATENIIKLSKNNEHLSMDHYDSIINDSTESGKEEPKECTGADSSGSFAGSMNMISKKDLYRMANSKKYGKPEEVKEITDASSSGQYDAPFGNGSKNPLKIHGEKSIAQSRAVRDKNFPKWGGPGSKFIKIKDKCKKFPYCNQGDINAIEMMESSEVKMVIKEMTEKYGISEDMVKTIIKKNIDKIFI